MSRVLFTIVVILGAFYADGLVVTQGPAWETTEETTSETTSETTTEPTNAPACLPCSEVECKAPKCPLCRHIKDLCGCCDICGRTLGEFCSGSDRCSNDLWCIQVNGDRVVARRQLEWNDWFSGVCGALET